MRLRLSCAVAAELCGELVVGATDPFALLGSVASSQTWLQAAGWQAASAAVGPFGRRAARAKLPGGQCLVGLVYARLWGMREDIFNSAQGTMWVVTRPPSSKLPILSYFIAVSC